jgi:hypothetical protein
VLPNTRTLLAPWRAVQAYRASALAKPTTERGVRESGWGVTRALYVED